MATLREIKGRIVSITNTRKITSAMKMVSSSKLHKAQHTLKNTAAYATSLHRIMHALLSDSEFTSPLSEKRTVRHAVTVVFTSDNALCGAFNANTLRELQKTLDTHRTENIRTTLCTIGRKAFDFARKTQLHIARNYEKIHPAESYTLLASLAEELIEQYENKEIDRVDLIYHRFGSTSSQRLVVEPFLPLLPPAPENATTLPPTDYILEPDRHTLMAALIPQNLKLHLYTALLHSNASEHATRMIAMQTATDNADELVDELTVAYNKSRQQAITSELLDIVGGTVNR
ncbi:MAG: ATP synthase F1 subunit gamma [Tannerella sp.]|jgi:F-type H+-transporting ATPase subunit gamma|nr:ATP synthase F1 subunit gamma [Tannerella sp.]